MHIRNTAPLSCRPTAPPATLRPNRSVSRRHHDPRRPHCTPGSAPPPSRYVVVSIRLGGIGFWLVPDRDPPFERRVASRYHAAASTSPGVTSVFQFSVSPYWYTPAIPGFIILLLGDGKIRYQQSRDHVRTWYISGRALTPTARLGMGIPALSLGIELMIFLPPPGSRAVRSTSWFLPGSRSRASRWQGIDCPPRRPPLQTPFHCVQNSDLVGECDREGLLGLLRESELI